MIYLLLWLLVGSLLMNGAITWRLCADSNWDKNMFLFVAVMILLGPTAPIFALIAWRIEH